MAPDNETIKRIQELEAKISLLERELLSYRDSGNESRLRRAEIASGSGNWEIHLDSGKILGSEGALRLYGVKEAEMNYEEVKNIPLPEYRPLLDKALKELISENKAYNIVFKAKNAETGEIIDLHSTAEYDPSSRKIFGVIRDITEQKASEEQIKKKSLELAALLEITMDLLETSERRSVLRNILEGAKRLVGLETGAVYSINNETLLLEATIPPLPDDFPDEFRKALLVNHPNIAKVLAKGTPVVVPDITTVDLTPEERIIVTQREMRTLLFIPLIASGQSYGVIVLGTLGRIYNFQENEISLCRTISNIASLALENSILITNLKYSKDRAEESDKLKTAFLHNISHEIRTPLNAIIGFTGFLDQPDVTDIDRRKYIEIIHNSNNQLLSIINDIFNVSHIEAGQVLLKESTTDIRTLMNNLYIQFMPETEKKGLDFKLDLRSFSEDGNKIITDEGKLIQVLSNLISNAVKFTSKGFVVLGCSKENGTLKFRVEDSGIGIHESEQTRIFERFYQVDKSSSRIYSGAGLGLSISNAYVSLLGGKLKLESVPEKGSVFSFEIPCKFPYPEEVPAGQSAEKQKHNSGKKKTILIAEDELSNFLLLELMLKKTGARLIHAANGKEAVDMCRSDEPIDLILMDIKMPVMDGYKATAEIRKIRPFLPVIAQTAYTDNSDRQKAYSSGCSDFLPKPIIKARLLELVEKYLP